MCKSSPPPANPEPNQPENINQSGFWNSVIHVFTVYVNDNGTEHHISYAAVMFIFVLIFLLLLCVYLCCRQSTSEPVHQGITFCSRLCRACRACCYAWDQNIRYTILYFYIYFKFIVFRESHTSETSL